MKRIILVVMLVCSLSDLMTGIFSLAYTTETAGVNVLIFH